MSELERIAQDMRTYTDMLVSQGLLHLKGGNVSARLGEELIITRTRSFKHDLVAGRLIRAAIDSDDSVEHASSTLAMHRAIYRRTEAQAVMHGHPYHPALLSYYLDGFRPLDENGLIYLGEFVPCVAAPAFMAWEEEQVVAAMAEALASAPVAILRWHGTFALGDSLAQAFHNTQAVETAARFVYDLLRQAGQLPPAVYPPYVEQPG